jgi:hypothetical protein
MAYYSNDWETRLQVVAAFEVGVRISEVAVGYKPTGSGKYLKRFGRTRIYRGKFLIRLLASGWAETAEEGSRTLGCLATSQMRLSR